MENENTVSALQVSKYCPLVLQSCTVAGVPANKYPVCSYLSCVMALLVEQGNIHRPTSYYDGPWTLPISKIWGCIIHGVALYAGIYDIWSFTNIGVCTWVKLSASSLIGACTSDQYAGEYDTGSVRASVWPSVCLGTIPCKRNMLAIPWVLLRPLLCQVRRWGLDHNINRGHTMIFFLLESTGRPNSPTADRAEWLLAT